MRHMTIMPFIDATEEHPDVHVGLIDASSDADARQTVSEVANDARRLMDEVVEGWREHDELKGLDGDALLDQYGIKLGVIEVWQGERTVAWVQPLAPLAPPPPPPQHAAGPTLPPGLRAARYG